MSIWARVHSRFLLPVNTLPSDCIFICTVATETPSTLRLLFPSKWPPEPAPTKGVNPKYVVLSLSARSLYYCTWSEEVFRPKHNTVACYSLPPQSWYNNEALLVKYNHYLNVLLLTKFPRFTEDTVFLNVVFLFCLFLFMYKYHSNFCFMLLDMLLT